MNKRVGILGAGAYPSMAEISALLTAATIRDSKLTPEERAARKEEQSKQRELERIAVSIRLGKCPECQTKLARGKKNKHNDYKREWLCSNCNAIHSL